jgi:hypothetical protein
MGLGNDLSVIRAQAEALRQRMQLGASTMFNQDFMAFYDNLSAFLLDLISVLNDVLINDLPYPPDLLTAETAESEDQGAGGDIPGPYHYFLTNLPIKPGTVVIASPFGAAYPVRDDGNGGLLGPVDSNQLNNVNYTTGEINLYFLSDFPSTQTMNTKYNQLNASASSVVLTWQATHGSAIDAQQIWRKTGINGTYAQLGSDLGPTDTTYTDSTVSASTTYYYKVRGHNAQGYSAWSNEYAVTTPSS